MRGTWTCLAVAVVLVGYAERALVVGGIFVAANIENAEITAPDPDPEVALARLRSRRARIKPPHRKPTLIKPPVVQPLPVRPPPLPPPPPPVLPPSPPRSDNDTASLVAPWPRGTPIEIGQGPGGSFTHQKSIGAFDIFMPLGTSYLAVGRGIIAKVQTGCPTGVIGQNRDSHCGGGFGNHVVIEHPRRSQSGQPVFSLYAHMSQVRVRLGEAVQAGTELGKAGLTGYTTGPHMHFQFQSSARANASELGLRDATFQRGLEGAPAAMLAKARL